MHDDPRDPIEQVVVTPSVHVDQKLPALEADAQLSERGCELRVYPQRDPELVELVHAPFPRCERRPAGDPPVKPLHEQVERVPQGFATSASTYLDRDHFNALWQS